MDTIEITVSIDEDNNMSLAFNSDEEIKVKTTGDIDLSEYVKILTYLIDKKPKLSFTKHISDDHKINLIQETIEQITASFNESVADEDGTIDGDVEATT